MKGRPRSKHSSAGAEINTLAPLPSTCTFAGYTRVYLLSALSEDLVVRKDERSGSEYDILILSMLIDD